MSQKPKKKRLKPKTPRAQFAPTHSLSSLAANNQGFNQKNVRQSKIHIPRKPSR